MLLERELADLHGKEAALLFTSGYVSNWAALGTLASRHARLRGALRRRQPCLDDRGHPPQPAPRSSIFAHNDPDDLDRKLRDLDPTAPKLVAFESVYSMDGDIAPIAELCDVADAHGAMTYLDEVHARRPLRPARRRHRRARRPDATGSTMIEGTLGKAFGVMGGYIAGSAAICDFVRSFASGFIFTTVAAARRWRPARWPASAT